ncbi:threonylcarbamoyl-AMP synthase [Candidatus Parcubacteria bacterium]|nr:MAG: threonylcarbamoyl-AMP synthase [Candidatus Parcubacteria bacterium]
MRVARENSIDLAIKILSDGGTLVYPTETSYGLGCDATNSQAVAKIFSLKNRPMGKGMTILVKDIKEAEKYIKINAEAKEIIKKYWPGALNVAAPLLPASPIVKDCAIGGFQSVRVSSHPWVQALLEKYPNPLVSTSANLSGRPDIYDLKLLEIKPDLIIDDGILPTRKPSTLIKIGDNGIKVLRQGEIKV